MERMEDRDIRREIDEKLHAIEEKEHVRILYAVESGSRAWGLASPDSDYDVRFLYVRPMEEYLRLDSPRDVIEWQLDEVLDINGWDLRKALVQFQKGNATLFEWAGSPIVYRTSEAWQEIYRAARPYFSVKRAVLSAHWLSSSCFCSSASSLDGGYISCKVDKSHPAAPVYRLHPPRPS